MAFANATDWRDWLATNAGASEGLWLKIAKKNTGIPTVTYDQALHDALCYGWIDGQKQSYDTVYFLQKFTPRRSNSIWSQRNVGKVAELTAQGLMTERGLVEVAAAQRDGRWEQAYAPASTIEVPPDFQTALAANPKALEFFESLNKTKRYSFLWRIHTAKKPETRAKRISALIELLTAAKTL
jgi:uncharacterized protein YdeI (YjbR/CyaY-like superfamily)